MSRPSIEDELFAIATALGEFSRTTLREKAGCEYMTVQRHMTKWIAAGRLRMTGRDGTGKLYRVIDAQPGDATSRSPEQNMWLAMRKNRTFTFRDIAALANTTNAPVSEKAAQAYIRLLLQAGYLKVLEKALPSSGRLATYMLIRNSGPMPPEVQRVRAIFDPNTGSYEHIWRAAK